MAQLLKLHLRHSHTRNRLPHRHNRLSLHNHRLRRNRLRMPIWHLSMTFRSNFVQCQQR